MSRCTGDCCRDFILPFGPLEVERYKKQIAAGRKSIMYESLDYYGGKRMKQSLWDVAHNQLAQVLDMIIFKRSDWQNPQVRGKSEIKKVGAFFRKGQPYHHYTCKHFDGQNCKIYESRPSICRNHGENNTCQYRDCTNKEGCRVVSCSAEITKIDPEFAKELGIEPV